MATAKCPECSAPVSPTAIRCGSCGYVMGGKQKSEISTGRIGSGFNEGLEYSKVADYLLIFAWGMCLVFGLANAVFLVMGIIEMIGGASDTLLETFILRPVLIALGLAGYVLVKRIADLTNSEE